MAVLGDSRRLLKNLPAVCALHRQNLVNAALPDDRIAIPPDAGVQQQLVDVLEAAELAVDGVLAVPGAVVPPGDHHLIGVIGKGPVRVVQGEGRLRKAHRRPLLGAAEDHVLHLGPPQGLGALLPHDPEDGIGNIGFATAVGTYNGRNVAAELNRRLIRERLKALNFQ